MATPLSPDAFLRALLAEGVRVQQHGDWRTHNRNTVGAWGPVNGVMNHHTAGTNSLSTVTNGTVQGGSPLPGPLCIGLIDKTGLVHLVGYGRTNHAGAGSTAVFAAVVDERALPAPGPDAVDGNSHFYGFEIENLGDGHDPYPAAQMDAVVRVNAAICRAHGWDAASCIGHKEWTRRKTDPSFSMPDLRARITKQIAAGPGGPQGGDDMSAAEVYDGVWRQDKMAPSSTLVTQDNPVWMPESILRDIQGRAVDAQAKLGTLLAQVATQQATITKLVDLVGQGADKAEILAAVQAAIADAVVHVDVAVSGTPAAPTPEG